jgi:hypothetical protein
MSNPTMGPASGVGDEHLWGSDWRVAGDDGAVDGLAASEGAVEVSQGDAES